MLVTWVRPGVFVQVVVVEVGLDEVHQVEVVRECVSVSVA